MKKQKAAKKDFVEENLPHNRVEVFFDVIKQRYDVLLRSGAVLLIFLLPVIAVELMGEATYFEMLKGEQVLESEVSGLFYTVSLIKVGPIALFGLGLSGIMKICRNLVWYEPVFFRKDFLSGIRQNWIIYVFVFFIFAILNLLIGYLSDFILNEFLKHLPTGVCLAVLLPVGMYVLSATAVYKDGFLSVLRNSIKFFIKSAPVSLLFVTLLSAAFCIKLIEHLIVRYALIAVLTVVVLPLFLVAWTLYSHSIFDKMVNSALYPDYVDRGIQRSEK